MSERTAKTSTMHLSRLAGALLLASQGEFILIGNTKEPCDWAAVGFAVPVEIEQGDLGVRWLRLLKTEANLPPHALLLKADEHSMEAVARLLASRFLIRRNASVSERLWRIVTGVNEENDTPGPNETDASWLVSMPERVWDIVRDTALKCL